MPASYLDLRRLRYFEAIATAGSLSAAARNLNVAQPALTHQMGELEKNIGTPVFIRSSRGVELTDIGLVLLEHARIVLGDVLKAELAIRDLVENRADITTIRLGLNPSVSILSATVMREFFDSHPHVRLNIQEVRARHCQELIDAGSIDAAVSVADYNVDGASLGYEPFYLVRAGQQKVWPPPEIKFSELAKVKNFIHGGEGSHLRRVLDPVLRSAGVHLDISYEIDGFNARKQAVLEGLGATFLPLRNVLLECQSGRLMAQKVVDPQVRRELVLVRRKGFDPVVFETLRELLARLTFTGDLDTEDDD